MTMSRAREEEASKRYRLEQGRSNYYHQTSRKQDLQFSKNKSQSNYKTEEGEISEYRDFGSKAYLKSTTRKRRSRSRDDDNVYSCSGRDRIRGSDRKRERELADRDLERSEDYYEVKEEDDDERIFEESRKLREKFKRPLQEEKKDSPIANEVPVLLVSASKAEPFSVGLVKEDMFCENDIFGDSSPANTVCNMTNCPLLERDTSLNFDEWDDEEGYYKHRLGEVLDSRFEVTAALGKGVFSTVVRAKDLKAAKGDPAEVAIKIIRNNHITYKAGLDEQVILKKLADADPDDRCHCVRFVSSFKFHGHLCLVFEILHMNLREVLKKFGPQIGLSLPAVRRYAKQLFIALKHLRNCGILHSDIKPDNILVKEAMTGLKLCDFGNAMLAGKNELTPYLVSRFYRAPEIILGVPYDYQVDIWSVGCSLYELYCGKVLFPGASNNDMLRLHMQLKGSFPKRMLRNGAFTKQNFDLNLNFIAAQEDPIGKKPVDRCSLFKGYPGEDKKMLAEFRDLLDKIFILDPEKRLTVAQALNHPFITGSQPHRPLPPRMRSCSATAFGQSPASMHMTTKVANILLPHVGQGGGGKITEAAAELARAAARS
ncbi:Serine/threonine-protein kinase PRP4-like protein [Thalictrum thalictroides]|uniref:non-specific serine/threonine protein kinase n=1 Tax=Thalictrum thalictroides TaxID=46969 RepID=A0A7J6WRI9_THATH|nr:Serine/threonine-protein kinase PRP4-like protein [Thalictrum thalictroides]